ncbi:MAG: hypothetical protein AAF631_11920 [Pseudomonadota bacterium]
MYSTLIEAITISYERLITFIVLALCTLWALLRIPLIFQGYNAGDLVFPLCTLDTVAIFSEHFRAAICEHVLDNPSHVGQPYGFWGYYGIVPCDRWVSSEEQDNFCRSVYETEVGSLYDPMGASSVVTSLVGLWLSMIAEPQFRSMSSKIRQDHLIAWSEVDELRILDLRFRVSLILGVGLGIFVCGWSIVFHHAGLPHGQEEWEHLLSSILISALAGFRLGTLSVMGVAARRIMKRFKSLKLIGGHNDGMGGAKPVGDFLAIQGMVSAILPLWLSLWIMLQWVQPSVFWTFNQWLGMHLVMLVVALGYFWFSFVWPFFNIVRLYKVQRRKLIETWENRIHQEIAEQNRSVHQCDAVQIIESNKSATEALELVKGMATVPLGLGLQSLFSLSVVFPTLTAVLTFLITSDNLKEILELISTLVSK